MTITPASPPDTGDQRVVDDAAWIAAINATVYDVVPRSPLPVLDPSLNLKQLLIHKRHHKRIHAMFFRHNKLIAAAYVFGCFVRIISIFVSLEIARYTAVLSLAMQIPAAISVMLQFRVELLKLLLQTYDFWYYFAMNAVWVSCFVWYFNDLRIAILPIMWLDVQNCTLLDSFLQDLQAIVIAAWVWCALICGLVVAISMDLVHAVHSNDPLLATSHRTVSLKEVLMNAVGTTIVLVLRVIYRKREALRCQAKSGDSRAQCITYKWSLRLQTRPLATPAASWHAQRRLFNPARLQLLVPESKALLKANDIVFPRAMQPNNRAWLYWLVWINGLTGLVATWAVFLQVDPIETIHFAIAIAALLCSATYCSVLWIFYQRTLLKRLCGSFDFAFVSLQITTSCIAVADLYHWHAPNVLGMLSCWLWMHTVMTLDALTPVMRNRLRFRGWFQIPVLVFCIAGAVVLWFEIFFWNSQGLQDRAFWHLHIGTRTMELHVVPFLFSRLMTLCLWCLRMMYRILTRDSDHDLMFVQSPVEFDAMFQRRRRKRIVPKITCVSTTKLKAISTS